MNIFIKIIYAYFFININNTLMVAIYIVVCYNNYKRGGFMLPILLGALAVCDSKIAKDLGKVVGSEVLGGIVAGTVAGGLVGGAVGAAIGILNKDDVQEVDVGEAANLLGISEYTVKKKIRDGELEGRIVGKKYMLPIESIKKYSQKIGKSGQILGQPVQSQDLVENYLKDPELQKEVEESWNNSIILKNLIDTLEIQKNIVILEKEKLVLSQKLAEKNNNEEDNIKLSQQIMDKEIKVLQFETEIKRCEAQLRYLQEKNDI